jgi:hypothetical protein
MSWGRNDWEFLSLKEELMHGRAYDNYRVGIEVAIKATRRSFLVMWIWRRSVLAPLPVGYGFWRSFGIWFWWHLQSFCWFYTTNMLMMYGCLLIPKQISCSLTHLLVHFSLLYRWGTACFAGSWYQQKYGPRWHTASHSEKLCIPFARPLSLHLHVFFQKYGNFPIGYSRKAGATT